MHFFLEVFFFSGISVYIYLFIYLFSFWVKLDTAPCVCFSDKLSKHPNSASGGSLLMIVQMWVIALELCKPSKLG